MGAIEDTYEELDAEEVSLEEFREAVEAKVEQMGGLADEETAAMLIAHEIEDNEADTVADVKPGMEEVKFLGKVTSVGELRTFERDGEDEEDGHVINVEVADQTGSIRCAFWDERAAAAEEELEVGQVLRIKGRPKEGYSGVEVSVDEAEPDDDAEIEVQVQDRYRVEDLSLGLSDVNVAGVVLDVESVRTFDRDDGSEGKVANVVLGDETGRVRVTGWGEMAETVADLAEGAVVELVDGYVREREGSLEVHVNEGSAIEDVDEEITYSPEATPIADLELDTVVDIAGVVRSTDPKRTFDRDDGSEGQVRNVRVQDDTGDIRVALWGEKADKEIAPGDEVAFADVEIQDGWQDDLEASAGWQSTVSVLDGEAGDPAATEESDSAQLGSFGGDDAAGEADGSGASATDADGEADGSEAASTDDADGATTASDAATASDGGGAAAATATRGETVEFTGTVVQPSDPVVLDDGEETVSVDTSEHLGLGDQVTVRGTMRDGRIDADEVEREG